MENNQELVKLWHRTRPMQQPVTEGLLPLATAALASAALYGSLAKQLTGTQRELALQLREDQLATVRCLKGISRMAGLAPMQPGSVAPTLQTAEAALRKNYGQGLRALHAFESRSADGEYGAVFEALAVRQRAHLGKITELMGLL